MTENIGAYPPDMTSLAGKVRVLVGDTDAAPLDPPTPGLGVYAWYSDEELEALGEMNGSNPKRVAIWVLSQVAMSQAMLLKKWTSEDLQVDGPAILRSMEATLKRLAAEVEAEAALDPELDFFGIYGGTPSHGDGYRGFGRYGWWLP